VCEARIFNELDLGKAYQLIVIREGDEFKNAYQTRDGQVEN